MNFQYLYTNQTVKYQSHKPSLNNTSLQEKGVGNVQVVEIYLKKSAA